VHETGIAWNDPSGVRLRQWLGLDSAAFYDERLVAIVPMGFCYPGTGSSGDLPPREECRQTWHSRLLPHLPKVELQIIIGSYARDYYLPTLAGLPLNEAIAKNWQHLLPKQCLLPHPSPRNQRWLRQNPWFETEIIPALQERVREVCNIRSFRV
jgi:uracil-DNA glycosylase